ncbi:MAG: retropepsin-like domain-containing protein [Candidatus Levybacteria bacterium]|nr:retropepsin-like domain-containing protein [Candidatus Levybacteria bacterium]
MKQNQFQTPIKIWYDILPGGPGVKWPILKVKLKHSETSLPQPLIALVDSGANKSILHPLVAEALGFNLEKLGASDKGISVSGEYKSWQLPAIDINIYGYDFNLPFTVIDNERLIWPCILGEDSIFNFARLDFQKFKGYFELRFRKDIN